MGVHQECLFGIDDVDLKEEEVWIVNAPAEIPPSQFQGQSLSFSGTDRISLNDQEYETNATKEKSSVFLVMKSNESDSSQGFQVKCRGEINIFRHVEVPELEDMDVPPRPIVAQPKNLVRRHPLFGIEAQPSKRALKERQSEESSSSPKKKKRN
eukprot:TRINITY_DN389_c1_g3_i1.p1 TRINITY_DN389_c1_g3~~TRINITY_DN389_c1_g3_i1.p1  ORF type:complete len:154 (-),score=32.43 TRINITY_DN389_c1_g3_i1:67-528(-)